MRIEQEASGTTSGISTFATWGVPEGEEREQEIENLFEKNDRKLP